ncbi:Predicted arabinose efflux permease, MFS family [Nonomuraea solani]|uniref:Predicted arabinose efflux permease, MFS family n=1 Tax=Nonomuraea solani TaxID=1144553 RepID=A0A1H6BQN6_9ACTN|nr:MFS transporter [Nonomuraea solani]SEG63018.1 Predicted arabinose efflux permease, MFS family [Nonomuraea solani]
MSRTGLSIKIVGGCYAAGMAANTVPTPLYPLYQQRDQLDVSMVTLVYGVYAAGVLASLLMVGRVSDHVGRRPVLVASVAVQALGIVAFVLWPGLAGLLVARVLSGLAVGILTPTASAYLADLYADAGPDRAARVGTAANFGGLAAGPLMAGTLGQWAPAPLVLPHLVHAALLAWAFAGLRLVPETRIAVSGWRYHPQRPAIPDSGRGLFWSAAWGNLLAFAVLGIFVGMVPEFLAAIGHGGSPALSGAAVSAVLAAGAVTQLFTDRLKRTRLVVSSLVLLLCGLTLGTVAIWTSGLVIFLLGGVLCGGGAGLLFKVSLATGTTLSYGGHERAGVLATLFLAAYVGMSVPVIGLGVAARHADARVALTGFTILATCVLGGVAPGLLRRHPSRLAGNAVRCQKVHRLPDN